MRRAKREHKPLGLIFLDFDYFKQYNDLYGHLMGDKALHAIAQTLLFCARRSSDLVARYGGDEFNILLANTTLNEAINIAKKIQLSIKNLHIEHAGSKVSQFITTTIGITSFKPSLDSTPADFLQKADAALNYGKKIKRNNIYIYSEGDIRLV